MPGCPQGVLDRPSRDVTRSIPPEGIVAAHDDTPILRRTRQIRRGGSPGCHVSGSLVLRLATMTAQNKLRTLLLQSGGIDSAAAAINLLDAGHEVIALTLAKDASAHIQLPKKRAMEISRIHPSYVWAMADISAWDALLDEHIEGALADPIPVSCLTCILAKITAAVPYCRKNGIAALALGYTGYQSQWAEQTSHAIHEQRAALRRLGISLLLPSVHYAAKDSVVSDLIARELTPGSLENPCCIGHIGTQPTPPRIIAQVVRTAFSFLGKSHPSMQVVETIGNFPL